MPDDYQIPAIILIAALMLAFSYLHSRFRSVRTLLWMLALGFGGLEAILMWMVNNWVLAPGAAAPPLLTWIKVGAESALVLSSALFLASLSPLSFKVGSRRVLYVIPYTVPILIYSFLYYGVTQYPSEPLLRLYIFLAAWAAGAALVWSLQKGAIPVWLATLIVAFAAILCARFFIRGDVHWPLLVVEAGNMLMTALLIVYTFRRLSPGVFLTVSGFLASALPPFFLIYPDISLTLGGLLLARAAVLGNVFVAMGLILLVLEDEVQNDTAQRRERRVRLELEAYTRPSLTARSLEEFDRECNQLCAMIAEHSVFAGIAMALRTASGAYSLIGYAGIDGATAGALDALMQRLPSDAFVLRVESAETSSGPEVLADPNSEAAQSTNALVPGSSVLDLDLKPWFIPGDDLERLGLTRIGAVPMHGPVPSPGNVAEGALLLTEPRVPVSTLRADDMLPLEILAGRLQAARAQALMLGKLIESERFAGVGQLATNVAQQLNNPLTVILGYSALLEDAAPAGPDQRAAESISLEARRMKGILERLARFSRLSTERFHPFSIGELVTDIEQMLRTDFLRHSIEFRLTIEPDLPQIFGNTHQMRQALLHATRYAIESVQRVGPNAEKSVRIEVHSSPSEEGRVQILVAHSGPGFLHPERAFESLTSGFAGTESTGIGLSLTAAIVREHRGNIAAVNYEPAGAGVLIDLPVS